METWILEFIEKIESTSLNKDDKAMAYLNLGEDLKSKGEDPTIPAFKALNLYLDDKNDEGVAQSCILLGMYLHSIEKNEHSLHYFLLAMEKMKGSQNQKLMAFILNKIGALYFFLKKYQESISYYKKCAELFEELGDLNEIHKIFGALGFIYQDLEESDIANEMFSKAAKIAYDAGDPDEAQKYTSFIL
ncbi:MAG: tetratricopeptide repeat protein [Promethearchaeota archaeon]